MTTADQCSRGRTHRPRTRRGPALWLAVLALGVSAPGCAAWQGARLYQSGTVALEAGDDARALDELQRAAALVPEASEVQNHLGLAWLANGDAARARSAFERALELDCDNEAARRNLEALDAGGARAFGSGRAGGKVTAH